MTTRRFTLPEDHCVEGLVEVLCPGDPNVKGHIFIRDGVPGVRGMALVIEGSLCNCVYIACRTDGETRSGDVKFSNARDVILMAQVMQTLEDIVDIKPPHS